MVFDAHDRAFAFFKGTCARGIYDNMKTAVDSIFIGKDRAFNRRFAQMCGHYLIDPTACTPASGWEKGQVENQVGLVRERFFTPRLKVARVLSVQPLQVSDLHEGGAIVSSPGDVLPLGHGSRSSIFVIVAADEVALLVEVVVEGGMHGAKLL